MSPNPERIRIIVPTSAENEALIRDKYDSTNKFLDQSRDALLNYLQVPVDANFTPTTPRQFQPDNDPTLYMIREESSYGLNITQKIPMDDWHCIYIKIVQDSRELRAFLTATNEDVDENTPDVISIGKSNYLIEYIK